MEQGETSTVVDRIWGPVLVCDLNSPYYGKFVSATEHREYTRSGHAAVKVFTGGRGVPKRQIVVELYAWASQILSPLAGCVSAGSGDLLLAAAQTTVGDFGVPNDDYTLYALAPQGVTKEGTLRAPVKRQSFYIDGGAKDLVIECVATTPTNRARTTVGVGEEVTLKFDPVIQHTWPWWTNTAGRLYPVGQDHPANQTSFTAPSNAVTGVRVVAYLPKPGGYLPVVTDFTVKEPTGINATIRGQPDFFAPPYPKVGAGMYMDVVLQPTNVSFYRVEMMEPSESATGTGYFANNPPQHGSPQGANAWHPVDYSNKVLGPPIDLFDHAADAYGWPVGVSGTYTWPIHPVWRVGAGDTKTNSLAGWTSQVFTLSNNGTMRIDKLGHHVTRGPYEERGTAQ